MKKSMHNFTKADIGKACAFTAADGASYSGRLLAVTPTKLQVGWQNSPTTVEVFYLMNYECRRVTIVKGHEPLCVTIREAFRKLEVV